jgi:hypothetical protein
MTRPLEDAAAVVAGALSRRRPKARSESLANSWRTPSPARP